MTFFRFQQQHNVRHLLRRMSRQEKRIETGVAEKHKRATVPERLRRVCMIRAYVGVRPFLRPTLNRSCEGSIYGLA